MKFAKKSDLIIIILILLVAVGVMFGVQGFGQSETGLLKAEIYCDSELVKTVELNSAEEYSFSLPEAPQIEFTVYPDGSIAFTHSDCPDQVCVHTGKLNKPGQIAACVPNRVYVKIVSDEIESDVPDIIISAKSNAERLENR